jgi:uncharacterized membrane protein
MTDVSSPADKAARTTAAQRPSGFDATSKRIATIDWIRGLVIVLMVIDHASMAFDGHHLAHDSAL